MARIEAPISHATPPEQKLFQAPPQIDNRTSLNLPFGYNTDPDGGHPSNHESAELPFAGKTILITGGSRDIGAGIVKNLAAGGAERIVVGYNNKAKRAQGVETAIAQYGGTYKFVGGDITTSEGIDALDAALSEITTEEKDTQASGGEQEQIADGSLDILILNAASSKRELNVDANLALIDRFLPKMKKGGKIVFMQSGPGRYYSLLRPLGMIPQVYVDVAETKDQGDRAIEERLPQMQERGVSLVRAVLPAVPDSTNVRLFTAQAKRVAQKEERQVTFEQISDLLGLPVEMSVDEAARAVVDLLAKDTGPDHVELFGPFLDGRQSLKKLCGENAMYIDIKDKSLGEGRMIVTPERANRWYDFGLDYSDSDGDSANGTLEILPEDAEGHFFPESGLPLVLPAHKQIRAVVETLRTAADIAFDLPEDEVSYVRLRGFESAVFKRPIKPGETIEISTKTTTIDGKMMQADATITIGEEEAAQITGIVVELIDVTQVTDVLLEDQIIEGAAQFAGLEYLSDPEKNPLFLGIGKTIFTDRRLKPGDVARFIETEKQEGKREFTGSVTIEDQDGNKVAEIHDMRALLSTRLVRRTLGV